MSERRSKWVFAGALALCACLVAGVTGCETVFGIGDLPFPADGGLEDGFNAFDSRPPGDAGGDTRVSDSGQKDAMDTGPTCTPTAPYTPVPWKPPTASAQPACTTAQLTAYETCFPNCGNFRQNIANAACVACIETDELDSEHGPVITSSRNGAVVPVEVNIGGCIARADGNVAPGSCGDIQNQFRGCEVTECGSCSDFADPMAGGLTQTCEQTATSAGGTCSSFVPQSSCDAELDGGVASACGSLASFLPSWCAPPAAGPPACYAGTVYTPLTWSPPTPFGQMACSSSQISAYIACLTQAPGNCSSFEMDLANATCVSCIETPMGAAQAGPVITQGGAPLVINFGGCVANFDGNTGAGSCGDQINNETECASIECGMCSDFAMQTQGGPTQQCEAYALNMSAGACNPFAQTMTCGDELGTGGIAATCDDFTMFLPIWCGGETDAGPPDSGPFDSGPSDASPADTN